MTLIETLTWSKTMLVNILHFEKDDLKNSKAVGIIATLEWDLDIEAIPFNSSNTKAPTHQVFAKSPRGHRVQCGAVWARKSKESGNEYLSISIPQKKFNANLGQLADQDDVAVQAIISWDE